MRIASTIFFLILSLMIRGQQNEDPGVTMDHRPGLKSTMPDFFISKDGLAWFSAERGLVAFDGTEYSYFSPDPEMVRKLGLDHIFKIIESESGDLWICSYSEGKENRRDYHLIRYFRRKQAFRKVNLSALDKLLFTDEDRAFRGSLDFSVFPIPGSDKIFLTAEGKLFTYDLHTNRFTYYPLPTDFYKRERPQRPCKDSSFLNLDYKIHDIEQHATLKNCFWLGSSYGVFLYDTSSGKILNKFWKDFRSDISCDIAVFNNMDLHVVNDSMLLFIANVQPVDPIFKLYHKDSLDAPTTLAMAYTAIYTYKSKSDKLTVNYDINSFKKFVHDFGTEWMFDFSSDITHSGRSMFRHRNAHKNFPRLTTHDGKRFLFSNGFIYPTTFDLSSNKQQLLLKGHDWYSNFLTQAVDNHGNALFYDFPDTLFVLPKASNQSLKVKDPISEFNIKQEKTWDETRGIFWDRNTRNYYCHNSVGYYSRSAISMVELDQQFKFTREIKMPAKPVTSNLIQDGHGSLWFLSSSSVYCKSSGASSADRILAIDRDPGSAVELLFASGQQVIWVGSCTSDYCYLFHYNSTLKKTDSVKFVFPRNSGGNIEGEFENTNVSIDSVHHKLYFIKDAQLMQYDLRNKTVRVIGISNTAFSKNGSLVYARESDIQLFYSLDSMGNIIIDHHYFDSNTDTWQDLGLTSVSQDSLHSNYRILPYGQIQMDAVPILVKNVSYPNRTIENSSGGSPEKFILVDPVTGTSHPIMPMGLNIRSYKKTYIVNGKLIMIGNSTFDIFEVRNLLKGPLTVLPRIVGVYLQDSTSTRLVNNLSGQIQLDHRYRSFRILFSAIEFLFQDQLEYSYRMVGYADKWITPHRDNRTVGYSDLSPGQYQFQVRSRLAGGAWSDPSILHVIVMPAYWQTFWFKALVVIGLLGLVLFILGRIHAFKNDLRNKAARERQLMELEAKALRSQMNPHFIFNCMNSIKAMMQKGESELAIEYLTKFSRLIRNVLEHSDKKEISLYDEIETCRQYCALEDMRFRGKFIFAFDLDPAIDLKFVQVPALMLQPYIENAIWHGIMPKGTGGVVNIRLFKKNNDVICEVDDNGVGRERSKQMTKYNIKNKESRGMQITANRLELEKLLTSKDIQVEVVDKRDQNGDPTGTTVVLRIINIIES